MNEKTKQQCSRAFLCQRTTYIYTPHMYTYLTYERPHDVTLTHSSRPLRGKHLDEMQIATSHTSPLPHPAFYFSKPYLCPRRACQLYLSPNISLCYYPQMGNETLCFFFCTSATRSPIEEKITTSRLIVESKRRIPITRSQ